MGTLPLSQHMSLTQLLIPSLGLSASSCKICSLCSTDITWSIRNLGRWEPRRESAAQGQKGHAYGGLTKALPSSALPAAALRIWKSLACSRPQTPPCL